MDTRIALTFYADPGHGWLEVPDYLLNAVMSPAEISHYSYRKGDTVYLEEDADAPRFLAHAKEQGYDISIIENVQARGESRIRSYRSIHAGG